MTRQSTSRLRLLHAVRLLGFADGAAIAARAGSSPGEAADLLEEAESRGWVQRLSFADLEGWSLTDAGRTENERQLAIERESADPSLRIAAAYREFLPLNARLLRAVTDWQISPTATDAFASNDHSDGERDGRILSELSRLSEELTPLADRLSGVLVRFSGYAERFASALDKAKGGQPAWVDRTGIDSCHRVWFELHEDLLATLGVDRRDTNPDGFE
ncbi:transcriptional regulator [Microbacterium sp.]|uniref:transcriptional regulator n=1 Tax=Microbacterium sp. TaxID=51671 RepID=UPI00281210AD|nr:transcriptional regulator [Microbacterium sp.]